MAVQQTGLKYTSEGIDQFVSNLKKAQLNLTAFTNSGKASSTAIKQAAADVRLHASSLNAMSAASKSITSANNTASASIRQQADMIRAQTSLTRAQTAADKALAASQQSVGQSASALSRILSSSAGPFGKLGQAASELGRSLLGINRGASSAIGAMTGITSISRSISSSIDYLVRRVILLTATYAAVGAVKEWISTGFEQVIMYDSLRSSLEALIARELVQSGQVADMSAAFKAAAPLTADLTRWVERLGILSIFESGDIKNVVQLAMAVGITTENAKALTLSLVDWGSVFQATPAKLEQVTHALTDMFTKGKVQSEELTRQLANHGIPAWTYLADALGVTTAEAKDLVFKGLVPANVGIKAITDGINKDFGGASTRMSTTLKGLTSSLSDLKKIALREFFTGTFTAIMPHLDRFVTVLQDPAVMASIRGWGDVLGQAAAKVFDFAEAMFASGDPFEFLAVAIDNVIPGFYRLFIEFGKLGDIFAEIAGKAFGWGENIGSQLAEGVIQAATYIVQALQYIGNIISSWLSPGSPPKLLPDLPEWGAEAMNQWIGGWTKFDQSIFKDLQSVLRDSLENLAVSGGISEDGIIPALLGGRSGLARATKEISEFGEASAEALSEVDSWINSVDPNMKGLVDTYFEWEKASLEVKKAQEDLNEINEKFEKQLKDINKAYQDQLGPLEAQKDALDEQEQALRDQQRIQKANETISDDESTEEEKALARLEIEQIRNRQQIDLIENRQEAEVSAVEAAQEAEVAAAEERLAEAERRQELAQTEYDNKVAQIELQKEHNSLIAEQTKLLETQAAAAEKAAGGGGGGGGAGKPSIDMPGLGPLDLDKGPLADLNTAFEELDKKLVGVRERWAGLKKDFDDAKVSIAGVKDELAPLSPLAAGIGFAFSSIAAGGVAALIARLIAGISPIGALVTAGMLLFQAWTSNFMGIQEIVGSAFATITGESGTLQTFWNGTLLPAITAVSNFFKNEVGPVAIDIATQAFPLLQAAGSLVASIFNNVVVPAARMFWSVSTELLWPIIKTVAGALSATLFPALTTVANFISESVLPIFREVFNFVSDPLVPIVSALAAVISEVLMLAFRTVSGFITDTVVPALSKLWKDYIVPIIDAMSSNTGGLAGAINGVKIAFDFVVGVVNDFISSLGSLEGIINSAIEWLNDLANTISGINMPEDLVQESPSPFEQSLIDLGEAMQTLDLIAQNSWNIWSNVFSADNLENMTDEERAYVEEQQRILQELPEAIEDVTEQAAEFIRQVNEDFLRAGIEGYGAMRDNLHDVADSIDELYAAQDRIVEADKEIADANDEIIESQKELFEAEKALYEAMQTGDKEDIESAKERLAKEQERAALVTAEAQARIAAAEEERKAAEILSKKIDDITYAEESRLEIARQKFLESVQFQGADPKTAQEYFELQSKHIKDLADLDRAIASETDERKRGLLINERNFLIQQQKIEMDLFNSQAQARVDTIEESLEKIADAFAAIEFPDIPDNIGDLGAAFSNLTELIGRLANLELPPWLTPGSPTPLEMGIRGISSAMHKLSTTDLPVMRMELNRTAMLASASQQMGTVYNSSYTDARQFNLSPYTNNSPQQVYQSFEIMQSMYGGRK